MSIPSRQICQCPVCDSPVEVTELSCTRCTTRLRGVFPPPTLAQIAPEHQGFVETFVRCRGVIRDVERALGLSYPTVRAKLDAAIAALEEVLRAPEVGVPAAPMSGAAGRDETRRAVLRRVAAGELDPTAAAEQLRRLS